MATVDREYDPARWDRARALAPAWRTAKVKTLYTLLELCGDDVQKVERALAADPAGELTVLMLYTFSDPATFRKGMPDAAR